MTQSVQPKRAEAVIVGGGVVGCALAYALVKGGLRDVGLLERDRLGCGTTWHSAANIAMLDASSASYVDFYARNMDLFKRLADETGQEVGWRQTGRLQFATNERRARALKHVQAVARARGLSWAWVAPEAARERLPIIATQGLLGDQPPSPSRRARRGWRTHSLRNVRLYQPLHVLPGQQATRRARLLPS